MGFTVSTVTQIDGGKTITVKIDFDAANETATVYVSATVTGDAGTVEDVSVEWKVGPGQTLAFSSGTLTGHAACIASCLGIAIGKALLECLIKSGGKIKKIEVCLKDKAIGASLEAAICIAGCLGLVPA